MTASQTYLENLRDECSYSDEGGFTEDGRDLGSVDALIDYKNALEDAFSGLLDKLAAITSDVDEYGDPCSSSAADQCAALYALLSTYDVEVA